MPLQLVHKPAWLSPAWESGGALAVRGMREPRTVIRRGALVQAWLVSVELIWHRIWECGFGGQS